MGLRTWLGLKKRGAKQRRDKKSLSPLPSPPALSREIRIFRADGMEYTMFAGAQPPAALAKIGVTFVPAPAQADIVLAARTSQLKKYGKLSKRFAIWTDEPRYSTEQNRRSVISGVDNVVDVMNAYTGLIYQDNYHHLYAHRLAIDFDQHMRSFAAKPRRISMLATYKSKSGSHFANLYQRPFIINGRNIDLVEARQAIAILLYKRGQCDIYGRDWPEGISISGESRGGEWWQTKRKVLELYSVNLAFENTIIPNYVTEKIWDAVAGATLPVYHGAENGAYGDFPYGSFIEAAGKTTAGLADEILQMPRSECMDRYEACLQAYIPVAREDRFAASNAALTHRTAAFIEEVMSRKGEQVPHLSPSSDRRK